MNCEGVWAGGVGGAGGRGQAGAGVVAVAVAVASEASEKGRDHIFLAFLIFSHFALAFSCLAIKDKLLVFTVMPQKK